MLDHNLLRDWTFPDVVRRYDWRDCILYALGIGCGAEAADLRFVYERSLEAFPTMAAVIADPGMWLADPRLGVDVARVVHGAQSITLHEPLPAAATVIGSTRLERLVDKGAGRGAYVHLSQTLREATTGRRLATLGSTVVLRGDGGFGGADELQPKRRGLPDRPCDVAATMAVLPQAALIYRLSGDLNPLHADPAAGRRAGFPGPILHGLCTMAIAARAVLALCCGNDPARLAAIAVRFTAPVFPGEVLRTEIWQDGDRIAFRTLATGRETTVLDGGEAAILPPAP